jgi:imidazolonepropionase-like amidohydrolase
MLRSLRAVRPVRVCALLLACACTPRSSTSSPDATGVRPVAGPTYAFLNGRWFNGTDFDPRTFYSVNGMLDDRAPARVDSTFDLAGGFVVPPFGDAHTHNLDGSFGLDEIRNAYTKEGTFYVQVLTNTRSGADQVRAQFNRPCALDVLYANGGLTSTLSHPFLAYEPRAMGLYRYDEWRARADEIRASRKRENDAYWFIDSMADLDAKWPKILDGHPDLVKVYLLGAIENPPPRPQTGLPTGEPGLRPSVAREIVRRAHAAGLRVAAHIETASDFEIAVRAGVDMLAHLPGYEMSEKENPADREISEDAARLAGTRGLVVSPTLTLSAIMPGPVPDSSGLVARRLALQRRNLELLLRHGVRVVVGSDWYARTAWNEFDAMRRMGLWDNRALLRIWAVTTPQSIFPRRRIGVLAPGYEASFLVLGGDPIAGSAGIDALRDIRLRVKQGCVVR